MMRFTTASREDFPQLNALFMEMLRTIYNTDEVECYGPGDLDHYFDSLENRIYTVWDEERMVAFLSVEVHHEEGGFLYLDDFSVTRACRGRGIGSKLLEKAETYAAALDLHKVRLHVEKSNVGAMRLYLRKGYVLLEDQGERCLLQKNL